MNGNSHSCVKRAPSVFKTVIAERLGGIESPGHVARIGGG